MQVTETLSEGLKRGFSVVVPGGDLETRRTAKLSELARNLRLPGFRPGKVPDKIVRQRYGTAVMAEVLEESVSHATEQVLSDRGLRAASQPKVDMADPQAAMDARELAFTVEVELLPEITLPDFSALHLTRLKAEPGEEAVQAALEDLARRHQTYEPVAEPRPAARGETLTVNYTGRIDGTAFPGGTATDADIEVAGPNFIPGFTEQLEGMAPGETRTIEVTFPADYGSAELAGKAAQFEIEAKALKIAQVPPLDDTLAEKIGFDTLEEVRDALRRQMQREFDGMSRMRIKRELLDALSKLADFPIPASMLAAEFEQIWSRVQADKAAGKLDAEDQGKDEEVLKADYSAIAERRVRLGLLLSEVGRREGVQVSSEELNRAIYAESARYGQMQAQMLDYLRKTPEAAERFRGPIYEEKVVDYILDQAQVEEKTVSAEELAADPDEVAGAAGENTPADASGEPG